MRVFVLGAGASVHAGYPLTKDLGVRLFEYVKLNPGPTNYPYWPDVEELAKFGSPADVEELVSRLEESEKPGGKLAGLREAICSYFRSVRPGEAETYKRFADKTVRPGNVIISFNYDLSLELELKRVGKWEASDGYGFDLGISSLPKSPIKLLKLHGSTNWMDLLFDGLRAGQFFWGSGDSLGARPVSPWGLDHLGYAGVKDPKWKQSGVDRSGSMILPGRRKRFYVDTSLGREREKFWTQLWTQAAEALRRAQEIVIIGYSCPKADAEARKLLFKLSNKNCSLTICCGSQTSSLRDEFVQYGFDRHRIQIDWRCFEDFLAVRSCEQVS